MTYGTTKQQIARAFDVSLTTVDSWVERGWLPQPLKFGDSPQSRVRFPDGAIEQLAARFRTDPTRQPAA